MIVLEGKGVSPGVAEGPVMFFKSRDWKTVFCHVENSEGEKQRFFYARMEAVNQLNRLAASCANEAGRESAALFEAHAMLAEDEDYGNYIIALIDDEQCNAEYAVQQAGDHFAAIFAGMEDSYMRARAADIRDVSRRIVNILTGTREAEIIADHPAILAADDLAPSETVRLDRRKILGIITRKGTENSHTAILARTMGIPAICGLGESLRQEYEGKTAFLDGEKGQVVLEPDAAALMRFREKALNQKQAQDILQSMIGQPDETPDGQRIEIGCNIGAPEDMASVLANDGRSIGLFRTEFLYLAEKDFPTEETQFQAYKATAEAMKGGRVVIRTLDIGADKQADYFGMKREENPALGMRGIRLSLNHPELFRTQLRAIYRASAWGRIAIMFPMIASLWELQDGKRICESVMKELEQEGKPFNRDTEIGIMIETPASALIADSLAKEVDFFSIGTNDLTQYILAWDRQTESGERFFDARHQAVYRAIEMAAKAGHDAGIWVGICGELAADPKMLPFFLKIGIDELSVSPASVLPLRAAIRSGGYPGIRGAIIFPEITG